MIVFLTIMYAFGVSALPTLAVYAVNLPMEFVAGIWMLVFVIGLIVGPSRAKAAIAKSQLRPYQQQAINDVKLDKVGVLAPATGKTVIEDDRKVYSFYSPGRGRLN